MHITNKFLTIIALATISFNLNGQVNTYSPYSRFGVGELEPPGYGRSIALGYSGIGLRSNINLNPINPASYTAIDTMSFLFDFGLNGSITKYMTNEYESELRNVNMHHIAIGFPITKWWNFSAGIGPYSHLGYNIVDNDSETGIGLVDYYFEGNGGLNNFYLGTSVKIFDKLSVGVNYNYLFGFLTNKKRIVFPTANDIAVTELTNRMNVRDNKFRIGLQYEFDLKNDNFLTLGAIYDHEASLKANQLITNRNIFPGTSVSLNDSTVLLTDYEISSTEEEGEIVIPRNMGFGFSAGKTDRLIISGEYSQQEWSKSLLLGKSDSLVNSNSFRLGLEVTPDPEALRGYLKRVHYRLGGYYTNSYLRVRNEQLKDYGITFGVGLPIRGNKTTFNLGMVLGQRGTLNKDLVKENYSILSVTFTFHDIWFRKRVYE